MCDAGSENRLTTSLGCAAAATAPITTAIVARETLMILNVALGGKVRESTSVRYTCR